MSHTQTYYHIGPHCHNATCSSSCYKRINVAEQMF